VREELKQEVKLDLGFNLYKSGVFVAVGFAMPADYKILYGRSVDSVLLQLSMLIYHADEDSTSQGIDFSARKFV